MNDVEQAFREFHAGPNSQTLLTLLRACQTPVYNLCYQALGHAQDAEDAAQEVLIEILEGARQVKEVMAFRQWMYRVTVRTAIDHRAKRGRRVALVKERFGMAELPTDPPQGDVRNALTEALARLDDDLRCLVVEHYFEKATLEDLGRRHGCSAVAIWKRIENAKKRLKQALAGVGLGTLIPQVDGVLESILPVAAPSHLIGEVVITKITAATLAGGIVVGTKTVLSAATIVTAMICLTLGTAGGMLIQSRRLDNGPKDASTHSSQNGVNRTSMEGNRLRDLEQQLALKDQELARAHAKLEEKAASSAKQDKREGTANTSAKEALSRRMAKLLVKLAGC